MLDAQPEKGSFALKKIDAMGMTPLHTAALYDQASIAEYLAEQVWRWVMLEDILIT